MSSMVRYPFIFMGENETLAVFFSYFTGSHLFPISQFEWIYNLTSHRYKIYHLSAGPYKKCQNPVQEDTAISLLWDWLCMSSDHTFSLGRNWITLQSVSGSLIHCIHRLSAAVMLMLRLKKSFPFYMFHKYRYYLCKTILIKLISHEFISATTKDNFLFPDNKLHCILCRYM